MPSELLKEILMTISGLLMLGAAEVVDSTTQELLGYAYTIEHGEGQVQRWLLFRNPKNNFTIRPPSNEMARWSLEDWQNHVATSWQPNYFYVVAQADVYEHGKTYNNVTWTNIPAADALPKANFPDLPGASYQLDYLEGKFIDVRQDDFRGRAYVVRGLTNESSIEYWVLPAHFKAAGNVATSISVGEGDASSLERFVTDSQSVWVPGATFVITGCLNYQNSAPPLLT
jgi:hypothetical protein